MHKVVSSSPVLGELTNWRNRSKLYQKCYVWCHGGRNKSCVVLWKKVNAKGYVVKIYLFSIRNFQVRWTQQDSLDKNKI